MQSELNFRAQKNGEKETRDESYIYKFSPELIIEYGKKKRLFIHRTSDIAIVLNYSFNIPYCR